MSYIKKKERLDFTGAEFSFLIGSLLKNSILVRFKAEGKSMMPYIDDGDVIVVSPIHNDEIAIDDVVAFIQPISNSLVVHRVIEIQNGQYLIKGDNTFKNNGLVYRSNILGRVSKVEKVKMTLK